MKIEPASGTSKLKASSHFAEIRAIAAGMLWNDRIILLGLVVLLILPGLLLQYGPFDSALTLVGIAALEHLLDLGVLAFLTTRWINRFRPHKDPLPRAFSTTLAWGMGFWTLVATPVILSVSVPGMAGLALPLLILALIMVFRYYFYFIPLALGCTERKEVLLSAQQLGQQERGTVIKTLLTPVGIVLLGTGIVSFPAPDGRFPILLLLNDIIGTALPLLSSYLAIAAALVLLPDVRWRAYQLDPYRTERMATLGRQGPPWLNSILAPLRGILLIFLGALMWSVVYHRLETTPPSAALTVLKIESVASSEVKAGKTVEAGSSISAEIDLRDEQFELQGFSAYHLRIAGARGAAVSQQTTSISFDGTAITPGASLPKRSHGRLGVTFQSNRSPQELSELNDLYIWYREVRVAPVKLVKKTDTK